MNASRQSFIVSAVICALMIALFAVRYRVAPYAIEAPFEGGMPLAAALTRFGVAHPWWAAGCGALMLVWTLLLVVQMSVRYAPAASRNYLPSQIALVMIGGVVVSGEWLASIAVAWLMALAMRQFIFSLGKDYRFGNLFHAGFHLGMVPLLYAPAAVLGLPLAVAALVIYRRSLREAIVCLVGLLLPVAGAGAVHWALGTEFFGELWRCAVLTPRMTVWPGPAAGIATAALATLLAATGALWAMSHKKYMRKSLFKYMQHVSLALLLTAATAALPGTSTTLGALLAVPCALCVPYAFQGRRAGFSTAVYSLMMIAAAIGLWPVLSLWVQ